METLIVRLTGNLRQQPLPSLEAAASLVLAQLPRFDREFHVVSGEWRALTDTGLHLEWAAAIPRTGSSTIQLDERTDEFLIFWGDLFAHTDPAATVWHAYRAGGIDAVRALDGCFSVVIGSLRHRTLEVCSDTIGQRTLRLADVDGATLISPHDTCLVACGLPVRFDPASQASCFVVQHSLGARSLLQDVVGLEANDLVTFHGACQRTTRRVPKLDFSSRIDVRDARAQTQCRESAVASVVDTTRRWTASGIPLRCELTAGLDSRVTLSCLLAAGVNDQIEAVTGGGTESLDVRTAVQLARIAQVRHRIVDDSEVSPESFVEHATLRAFATNGETEAQRAMGPLPRWNPDGLIRVGGASSEVFRGFFYPCMGPKGIAPKDFRRVVDLVIARRMRDFSALPLADESVRTVLRELLDACFDEYASLSSNGNDALDLLYLFERCAHWGAHVQRATWNKARNPLLLPSVVRELYRLPPPLGHHVGIHRALIERYFPESRWVPINGATWVALEGPGAWRANARFLMSNARKRGDKLRQRYLGQQRPKAQTQADHFALTLEPVLRDLFTAPGSVVAQLLGPSAADNVLVTHRTEKSRLSWLGFGATQELYARLLRAVSP